MQSVERVGYVRAGKQQPAEEIRYRGADKEARMPLTKRQRLFVEECLSSDESFEAVMKKHHVDMRRFAHWVDQPSFRKYLRRIFRTLARQREMILAIASVRGAAFLQKTANFIEKDTHADKTRSSRCRAALILIRLARQVEGQDCGLESKREKPLAPQLAHPDHSPEEIVRLLDMVEGKAAGKETLEAVDSTIGDGEEQ